MPAERTKQLVYELDAWYRSHAMLQKDLAAALDMSPQQLAEILALRNRPTGEQALQIVEFLRTENMTPTRPDASRLEAARKERLSSVTPVEPTPHKLPSNEAVRAAQRRLVITKANQRKLGLPQTQQRATPAPGPGAPAAIRSATLKVLSSPSPATTGRPIHPTVKAPNAAAEPAPTFSPQALAAFKLVVRVLERTDLRLNHRLLLAYSHLRRSGDPFIASINPDELLKEINAEKKQ